MLPRRVLQTRTRKFMKIWTSTNFGKFVQYCVHFLTTTPRAASFIPLQGLGSLKSSYLGRGIFLFAWFRIFLLLFPVVLRSWQVWQWKEEIATLRNMEEENTEPGWLGGVHKYSMEVVVRQLWQVCAWKCGNCHFTQASVEPQMGIQTLLSPQNIRPHTKRDFFGKSNLESVYQAALNSWLSRGGAGVEGWLHHHSFPF